MLWIRIDRRSPDRVLLGKAARIAASGGLVVYPTDTLYGLGTNPFRDEAVRRIYEVKKRDRSKPVPVLVSGIEIAERIAEITGRAISLIEEFWPGPLTIVVRAKPVVPCSVTACTGKIALRMPGDPVALGLIEMAGGALIGTSANISGMEPPRTALEAVEQLGEENIDAVVDAGPAKYGEPSTVVDLTVEPPRIIRRGVVDPEKVLLVLGYG